jgi:TPR repeat protein
LALHWFTQAAWAGNGEAMNMVGRCYENGWGTATDLGRAAQWYRRSAEAGDDWGQYNFANVLFDGMGIPCDRHQALRWYRRAADRGHSRAMNLLGRCFEEGWGCQADLAQAEQWYQRSAEAGYFRGQFNHACLLLEHRQIAAAAHWFLQAAGSEDQPIRQEIRRRLLSTREPLLTAIVELL